MVAIKVDFDSSIEKSIQSIRLLWKNISNEKRVRNNLPKFLNDLNVSVWMESTKSDNERLVNLAKTSRSRISLLNLTLNVDISRANSELFKVHLVMFSSS